jgi:rhodanese-related sulfurtransferase
MMVVGCFALDQCGVINVSRRSTYPPAYNFNSFNFNYRVPLPQFSPMPVVPELLPPNAVKRLTPAELWRRMRRRAVVVVDVRTREEYDAGHLGGALSMPEAEAAARAGELRRRRRQIVLYCASPAEESSLRVARRLWLAGHENVAVLVGGLDAWRAAGLPVERSAETIEPPAVVPPEEVPSAAPTKGN